MGNNPDIDVDMEMTESPTPSSKKSKGGKKCMRDKTHELQEKKRK